MRAFSTFLILVLIVTACQQQKRSGNIAVGGTNELFRSQFHFTPESGWMNDPNGMVYYDGEYHLFYQYYPDSTVWGPMHWGHAISKDMIHWERLPIALYPDSLGYIFSGSAVVDWKNTSGFGTAQTPPIVAIYTYHDPKGDQSGRIDFQTQGIAFSLDKGRTWNKYERNPVLANPGIRDFRDPKVSWNEVSNQWVMTLAVKDHIEFYASLDLKKWDKLSEFGKTIGEHGGVWECPDFFPLKDEQGDINWVLLASINPGGPQGGSATQYFVGKFDGKNFTSQDTLTRWIDYGADNYAGVTWSDIPSQDGRRLFLGWMSNWQYANVVPTKAWRSATTLPRNVKLIKKSNGYELEFAPVDEILPIQQEPVIYDGTAKIESSLFMMEFDVDEAVQDFTLTLSNDQHEKIIIDVKGSRLSLDRTFSGIIDFNPDFPAIHTMNIHDVAIHNIKLYVDQASVELFVNNGERVMTELVFPTKSYNLIKLEQENPKFKISYISSIWK